MWRRGSPLALLVGMQTGAGMLENSMEVKIELHYDPAIAALGIYPKDTKPLIKRNTCTPVFTAALSTIAKLWKDSQCPLTAEWIKKRWYIYTMEY